MSKSIKFTFIYWLMFLNLFTVAQALTYNSVVLGQTQGQVLGAATPAYVNGCSGNFSPATGGCTITGATANNVVVAYVAWDDSGSIVLNSITICGTTATVYDNPTIDTSRTRAAWAVAAVGASGNCVITA